MEGLKIYTKQDILELVNIRQGETKLGERVNAVSSLSELSVLDAQFVLLGIPEDIGVRANYGMAGASTAWLPALKALLNVQSTRFLTGEEIVVLGHFNFTYPDNFTDLETSGIETLQKSVAKIDEMVAACVEKIVMANKVPIVIGGGHNNAYPIIKAAARATKTAVETINIDAHADLRPTDGRHSGNGFSYALEDGFLHKYGVFGLHQNYNNEAILQKIEQDNRIHVRFFDGLLLEDSLFDAWLDFQKDFISPGLEIDLDSIENILSSASTPSGFSINFIRKIILGSAKTFSYLHICEGASKLADGRASGFTAKSIVYLVTDFVKSQKSAL